jgi:hypothetical protein
MTVPRTFSRILALGLLLAGGRDATAQAAARALPQAPATTVAPKALPAPYVALPAGTEYQYSNFTNRVTRSRGWQTWFVDSRNRPGLHVGLFILDDPRQPSQFDASELGKLWPLAVGNRTSVKLHRPDGTEEVWDLAVSDTATISVPLGEVFTYHVRAVQKASILKRGTAGYANLYEFWYAPAWGAVVRLSFAGAAGPAQGRTQTDQIVFIKRPAR